MLDPVSTAPPRVGHSGRGRLATILSEPDPREVFYVLATICQQLDLGFPTSRTVGSSTCYP